MDVSRNPVADRRALFSALRSLRERSGLSLDDAARMALIGSGAKLSRIETGKQLVAPRDVRDLCRVYAVDDDRTEYLMSLAESAREPGWLDEYDIHVDDYLGLEAVATSIQQFEPSVVPGLLQTREYAEENIGVVLNSGRLEPRPRHEIEQVIEIWDVRKQRLTPDSGVSFTFLIDEAALRRPVGGAMQSQIDHLKNVAGYPNVHMHILPLTQGGSPGQQGGFTLLKLPEEVPDIAYVESVVRFELLDSPDVMARLHRLFDVLHHMCPAESQTQQELTRIAGELAAGAVTRLGD